MAPCPPLETVGLADLFLGRPRSRRYPKFNIRRDIPSDLLITNRLGTKLRRPGRTESAENGSKTKIPREIGFSRIGRNGSVGDRSVTRLGASSYPHPRAQQALGSFLRHLRQARSFHVPERRYGSTRRSDGRHASPAFCEQAMGRVHLPHLRGRPFNLSAMWRPNEDSRFHHQALRHPPNPRSSRRQESTTSSPDSRGDLRSLSTTPGHVTRVPPASRKHGFLFPSTRVRTISASLGPSPAEVRLLGMFSGSCFPGPRVTSS